MNHEPNPSEQEELERIAAAAARLPVLAPSRDLWPDVAARLGAQEPAQRRPQEHARHGALRPAWHVLDLSSSRVRYIVATAATMLVAVSAGITWAIATSGSAVRGEATTSALAAGRGSANEVLDPIGAVRPISLDATVTSMDAEIAALQALVDDRRQMLDPATVAVLRENLALIDRAINESRTALAADPASRFLAAQFVRAYTSKLTLLRDAATLSVGT